MQQQNYITILCLLISGICVGQKYTVKESSVVFFSHAAIEDITATNSKATAIFDASSGNIAFSIPIQEFQFAKALMQEHFNEKYLESDKFPKASFEGKINGYDIEKSGVQDVTATGKLTIHGVPRSVDVNGTLEKQSDKLILKSKFIVKLEDYKISIPQIMWQKIAEQVEVTLDFTFVPK